MKDILSRPGLEVLTAFSRARVLIAFDFDGTLAPTVPDRDRAEMRPETRELLRRACRLYPCAVISGRSRHDVQRRLGSATVRSIIGNHGLEPSIGMKAFTKQIAAIRPRLEDALRTCAEIEVEDKRYSLALHYRHCSNKAAARRAIRAAIIALDRPVRILPGKLVVNVVPRHAPHKGGALVALWRKLGAQRALYVGDDVTDEDVFLLGRPETLVSIRVGRSRSSAASYYLRDQRRMDPFLGRLCALREDPGRP